MTPTEDETNWLPFTVRRKPCCTSANVIVLAERDPMIGAGRALPHKGLMVLQPWKTSKASSSALRGRMKALIRFIRHRPPGCLGFPPQFVLQWPPQGQQGTISNLPRSCRSVSRPNHLIEKMILSRTNNMKFLSRPGSHTPPGLLAFITTSLGKFSPVFDGRLEVDHRLLRGNRIS